MARLGDVFEIQITGEWGSECTENETGTKVLRTTNFTPEGRINYDDVVVRSINESKVEKKRLHCGDIILEKSGGTEKTPVGRVVFCDESIEESIYLCNNFTQAMRVNQTIAIPRYVFYFMWNLHCSGRTDLLQNKTTGIRNLQVKSYLNEECPLPTLDEQRKIAAVLDKVSDLIAKRRQQLDKLDEMVKARFVEMFGDPVTNPKGWKIDQLGSYMTTLTDFSANGSYELLDSNVVMYDEPNYAVMVRTIDLEAGNLDNGVKYIDQKAYELLSKSKLYGGELIMNKIGSAGKIYIMPHIGKPASLGRNAFMFRFDERINMVFLYALLTSDYGTVEIQQYVRGAVTKTITKASTKAIRIIVPPIELQNRFATFVEQTEKIKTTISHSLEKLETLKKALMQEYFG